MIALDIAIAGWSAAVIGYLMVGAVAAMITLGLTPNSSHEDRVGYATMVWLFWPFIAAGFVIYATFNVLIIRPLTWAIERMIRVGQPK